MSRKVWSGVAPEAWGTSVHCMFTPVCNTTTKEYLPILIFSCLKILLQLYAKRGTHSPEEMSSGPLGIKEGAIRRKSSSSAVYPRCERGRGIVSLSLFLRTQWICSLSCLDCVLSWYFYRYRWNLTPGRVQVHYLWITLKWDNTEPAKHCLKIILMNICIHRLQKRKQNGI